MSLLDFLFRGGKRQADGSQQARELDATIAEYRRKLRQQPRQAADWYRRIAEAQMQAGRRNEAVEAYLRAAEIHERDDLNLKAMALYKAVLRIDPDNSVVLDKLGELACGRQPEPDVPAADPGAMTLRTRLQRYAPLFSEMDRETLCAVVEVMECRQAEAGEVIFRQGDAGDSLFIITSGEVALTVESADKEAIELQRLNDGACFGEVSAISRLPRNVSAIATMPTELLELSRDYLEAVSIAHPQLWTTLERFQQRRLVPVGV